MTHGLRGGTPAVPTQRVWRSGAMVPRRTWTANYKHSRFLPLFSTKKNRRQAVRAISQSTARQATRIVFMNISIVNFHYPRGTVFGMPEKLRSDRREGPGNLGRF
jgi:hypothetical protein